MSDYDPEARLQWIREHIAKLPAQFRLDNLQELIADGHTTAEQIVNWVHEAFAEALGHPEPAQTGGIVLPTGRRIDLEALADRVRDLETISVNGPRVTLDAAVGRIAQRVRNRG